MNQASQPRREFVRQLDQLMTAARQDLDSGRGEYTDNRLRHAVGALTGGMSPVQLLVAYADWLGHLALSPAKREALFRSLQEKFQRLGSLTVSQLGGDTDIGRQFLEGTPFDKPQWHSQPFSLVATAYLSLREWVGEASRDVSGVDEKNERLVGFINDQILEALSPANFPATNPQVLETTLRERGRNLARGASYLGADVIKRVRGDTRPEMGDFEVGVNLATTPGKVIYRNELIELIQYSPTTERVAKEPVLMVPAWIMKYYILDLSPHNSMVKYLVDQGRTVFSMSWKNPGPQDRRLSFDDYLKRGLFEAIDAVRALFPSAGIDAVGYCIGGTLLAVGAAALARDDKEVFNTLTFFAAQVDFTEPGPIEQIVSEGQVEFLDSRMWTDGYLSSEAMAASFTSLRVRELFWEPKVSRYLLGREIKPNDLMAWNADGTRMPYAMHRRYLRELYLENRLAECRFEVDGAPVSLLDIRAPIFSVGTETDHVAPWLSVYKIHRLTRTEVTFLLTSGGHNAGIVSGPSHPRRHYRLATHHPLDKYVPPEDWVAAQPVREGSWWPAWAEWLSDHSGGERKAPSSVGAPKKGYKPICDAPGTYVFT